MLMLIYDDTSPFPLLYIMSYTIQFGQILPLIQHSKRSPARIVFIYLLIISCHAKFNKATKVHVELYFISL